MKLKNNKKASLEDIATAPLMAGYLILITAVFIMFVSSINLSLQSNGDIPLDAKLIMSEMNTINSSKLYYIPILFVIGIFIFTIAGAFFSQDPRDPLFIFSFIVILFYNIIVGIFKLFYLKLIETNLVIIIIDNMPGIQFYFDYLFIFQTLWFLLYLLIWGLRR